MDLGGSAFPVGLERRRLVSQLWIRSYKMSPQSKMRWRLKNTVGGHEEDGDQDDDHLQIQPYKLKHGPQEEEAEGGGGGHQAPEDLPLGGEGLADLEQDQKAR